MIKVSPADLTHGVKLMSSLLRQADKEGDKNQRVSSNEIEGLFDNYSDGSEGFEALKSVFGYAAHRAVGGEPSIGTLSATLTAGKTALTAAHGNPAGLARTWQALAQFSTEFKGLRAADVLGTVAPRNTSGVPRKKIIDAYWDDQTAKTFLDESELPGRRSKLTLRQIENQLSEGASASRFEVGGKTFFAVESNNDGNGWVSFYDSRDRLVASDSFSE